MPAPYEDQMLLGEYLRAMRGLRKPKVVVTELQLRHRQTLHTWESARARPEPTEIRRLLLSYGCSEEQIAHALYLRSLPLGVAPDRSAPPDLRIDPPAAEVA